VANTDPTASIWWISNSSACGVKYPWAVLDIFDDPVDMPVYSNEVDGPGAIEKATREAISKGCSVLTLHLWGPDHGFPSPNDYDPR